MSRHLVINADDFGLTPGVNAGIVHAHRRGVLTSASLFAGAPFTDDAIARATGEPTLGIGCHLTLVDGTPVLPPDRIPTLVGPDRRFPRTWGAFIGACLLGRVSLDEVERELTAQVARIERAGLRLTHLDAHKHVHAWPPVFERVIALADRFGISTVRVPFERPAIRLAGRSWRRPAALGQAIENIAMGPWALVNRARALRAGLRVPFFTGRVDTGLLDAGALEAILERLPEGTSELMTHPGFVDQALDDVPTRLRAERADEVALLCAGSTRVALAHAGVALVRHDHDRVSSQESLSHVS